MYLTLIEVHLTMHLMHHNHCQIAIIICMMYVCTNVGLCYFTIFFFGGKIGLLFFPLAATPYRRNLSLDANILIVSRASQLVDDDWMKVDIGSSGGGEGSFTEDSAEEVEVFQRKQLYLLVARCISYAFNTKHQIETSPPKQKLNRERYQLIMRMLMIILSGERHRSQDTFLTHQEQMTSRDQGFLTCLQWFVDTISYRQDVEDMCVDGRFSVKELENIFSARAKKQV